MVNVRLELGLRIRAQEMRYYFISSMEVYIHKAGVRA